MVFRKTSPRILARSRRRPRGDFRGSTKDDWREIVCVVGHVLYYDASANRAKERSYWPIRGNLKAIHSAARRCRRAYSPLRARIGKPYGRSASRCGRMNPNLPLANVPHVEYFTALMAVPLFTLVMLAVDESERWPTCSSAVVGIYGVTPIRFAAPQRIVAHGPRCPSSHAHRKFSTTACSDPRMRGSLRVVVASSSCGSCPLAFQRHIHRPPLTYSRYPPGDGLIATLLASLLAYRAPRRNVDPVEDPSSRVALLALTEVFTLSSKAAAFHFQPTRTTEFPVAAEPIPEIWPAPKSLWTLVSHWLQ